MRYEDEGFAELQRKVEQLVASVDRLERRVFGPEADAPPRAAPPPAAEPAPAAPPPPAAVTPPSRRTASALRRPPALDLEDLLGARLLAWVGGSAIFLGVVFFLVMAVRNGWIDEPTRVLLAFVGSTLLLGAGLYLYERRRQTEAAIAAVASSIAALYASVTVGTQLYDLIAPALGLLLAGLVGATATAIAVRARRRVAHPSADPGGAHFARSRCGGYVWRHAAPHGGRAPVRERSSALAALGLALGGCVPRQRASAAPLDRRHVA